MSSSINASTGAGGGVITTADASGILQLQSNGTTIMTVSPTGVSTQVGAPAFSAYRNANQTLAVSSTPYDVIFNTEEYDTNSNFDTSTGIFTPTVAGYYQFNSSVQLGAATTIAQLSTAVYKNGSIFKGLFLLNTTIVGNYSSNGSCLVYLNGTTDYVSIRAAISGTGALTANGSATGIQTWFNGFLARSV